MGESAQAVFGLLMIVGILGSVLTFPDNKPNWPVFLAMVALAVGSLGLLVWSLFRIDKAPDFLKAMKGSMFERDGFCFLVVPTATKGQCYLDVHFQSRYERPSRAMILIQPGRGFFLTREDVGSMTIEVECPAAGAGVTNVPWPVAKKHQGRAVWFEVGADVQYPEGKGKMVRFRGGKQVGPAGFDKFRAILTVAGAMAGAVVLSSPAKAKVALPTDVEESVPDDLPITTKINWKLGNS